MAIAIPLLIFGFVLLIKGAGLLIDGSSSIAKKFGISTLVIGLTIVAFGTSAPELLVNIVSSVKGNNELILGNIFGSNIANICLILGITALICNLKVTHSTIWREIPFALLAVLVAGVLTNDTLIDGQFFSTLTRSDGIIMIFFFIIFLYYTYGIRSVSGESEQKIKVYPARLSILMIIGGMAALAWGGYLVVDQAVKIAQILGVSETLIGLSILAIGTSMPELAASIIAAYKKNADIAVGNIVGTNIFNILLVLGLSSIIHPINVPILINIDIIVVTIATLLLFSFMFIGKNVLNRWQGITFICVYAAYIAYSLYRG